ncbi:hypothetical protein [Paraburkholderia sp. BL27I4N3]|uniref:hypothetical protein n=1 Tax=Paraburkholderia sp. BL27I4N3 TaxID=1938805 RepID=UPI0011C03F3B|nr:hypothetical protein [Paraburkholderia sp. BL27I4N3]
MIHGLSLFPFQKSEENCPAYGGKILSTTLAMATYNQISAKHTISSAWLRERSCDRDPLLLAAQLDTIFKIEGVTA